MFFTVLTAGLSFLRLLTLRAPSGYPGASELPCRLKQVVVFWTFGSVSPRAASSLCRWRNDSSGLVCWSLTFTDTWSYSQFSMCLWFVSNDMYLQWASWVSLCFEHGWSNRCPWVSWLKTGFPPDRMTCGNVCFVNCCLYYLSWAEERTASLLCSGV